MSILPAMPHAAASDGVELLELRVLDGPNRFFSRPAVKLEFGAPEPGAAAAIADEAGEIVRRLHLALDLPAPRLTLRARMMLRRSPRTCGTSEPSIAMPGKICTDTSRSRSRGVHRRPCRSRGH